MALAGHVLHPAVLGVEEVVLRPRRAVAVGSVEVAIEDRAVADGVGAGANVQAVVVIHVIAAAGVAS